MDILTMEREHQPVMLLIQKAVRLSTTAKSKVYIKELKSEFIRTLSNPIDCQLNAKQIIKVMLTYT